MPSEAKEHTLESGKLAKTHEDWTIFWLFLAPPGSFWLFLAPPGYFWNLLQSFLGPLYLRQKESSHMRIQAHTQNIAGKMRAYGFYITLSIGLFLFGCPVTFTKVFFKDTTDSLSSDANKATRLAIPVAQKVIVHIVESLFVSPFLLPFGMLNSAPAEDVLVGLYSPHLTEMVS